MIRAEAGVPVDIDLGPAGRDVAAEIDVELRPQGHAPIVLPAFGGSDGHVRVRFAAAGAGVVEYRVMDPDAGLDASGQVEVVPYTGENPLYRHGRLRASPGGRTLEHADGTPFLWIGDTWWMGLGLRLDWPDGFRTLLDDRIAKGFNVVQVVAGPLPDFASTPDGIWHPQQANEGGWPWDRDWARINPGYYEHADRKIAALVEAGIVPCIVGMWGFYGTVIGRDRAKAHWRNLVARYAAYPVVFCAAGEFDYPGYDEEGDADERSRRHDDQVDMWSEAVDHIARIDPYGNLVTLHPGYGNGRSLARADTAMTLDMLQTSHWSYHRPTLAMRKQLARDLDQPALPAFGFEGTLEVTRLAVAADPPMPVVNGEPSYEGILGGNWQDVQRFNFWTGMLTGLAGFTYGADGIWQMSSASQAFANSVSRWGTITWQQAMHHAGSRQVGLGRAILESVDWWELLPVSPKRARQVGRVSPFGAMSARQAIYYLPSILLDEALLGMRDLPLDVPEGASEARYVDPSTGDEHAGMVVEAAADGTWRPPQAPTYADWLLVIGPADGAR